MKNMNDVIRKPLSLIRVRLNKDFTTNLLKRLYYSEADIIKYELKYPGTINYYLPKNEFIRQEGNNIIITNYTSYRHEVCGRITSTFVQPHKFSLNGAYNFRGGRYHNIPIILSTNDPSMYNTISSESTLLNNNLFMLCREGMRRLDGITLSYVEELPIEIYKFIKIENE